MKKQIAVVLSAYNAQKTVKSSLKKIESAINSFSNYDFTLVLIDDKSKDSTYAQIKKYIKHFNLNARLSKNRKNQGLSKTLKNAYNKLIKQNYEIIIKTDFDKDFDQEQIIKKLLSQSNKNYEIITTTRANKIKKSQNPYEYNRKKHIQKIIEEKLNIKNFDPASCGSNLYKKQHLKKLLKHKLVKNYDQRWGFDSLLFLLSTKLSSKAKILKVKIDYNSKRRPKQKVALQYNTYAEIIDKIMKL